MARTTTSPERLRQLLRYEPETGKLFWLPRAADEFQSARSCASFHARFAGKQAFTANSYGYRAGRVDNILYVAHRVIWAIIYGEWPAEDIDHINGDRADNRLANLRAASRSENLCNRGMSPRNTSGHKGVYFDAQSGRWRAHIKKSGRFHFLGSFDLLDEALAARRSAETTLHGEFARAA